MRMELFGIKTPLIKPGDDIPGILLESTQHQKISIKDKDILAVTSKAISSAENRIVGLASVIPSEKAEKLAEAYSMEPEYVELIMKEADEILDGVSHALLTVKNGTMVANAGIDRKNAPDNHVALWPLDYGEAANQIRKETQRRTGKRIGVLLTDSRVTPLRMGTTSFALAISGFSPVKDCRGEKDLFGKQLLITQMALADDLACAAHLLMGETAERIPAVLIRGAPVELDEKANPRLMHIQPDKCLFMKTLRHKLLRNQSAEST